MSRTMIISSCSAPFTTVSTASGSPSIPPNTSRYMSATRRGVSTTPSRSGSSPIPSRIRRTPRRIFSSSNEPTEGTLRRDQVVQGVRQLGEVEQLGVAGEVRRLAQAVDPHGAQPHLHGRLDVVEQAGPHVGVAGAFGSRQLEEPFPVA